MDCPKCKQEMLKLSEETYTCIMSNCKQKDFSLELQDEIERLQTNLVITRSDLKLAREQVATLQKERDGWKEHFNDMRNVAVDRLQLLLEAKNALLDLWVGSNMDKPEVYTKIKEHILKTKDNG